jgi:putative acetyltransferase
MKWMGRAQSCDGVRPDAQRRGIGTALLRIVQAAFPRLQLWTFQRNAPGRRFYETRGFVLVKETDGARNDEKEPDALYLWEAAASSRFAAAGSISSM